MLERWFGDKIHHYLHLLGTMILAFGLPLNKVLMSIGAIWGIGNLVLEGKYSIYWENCKKNKTYLLLFAFFLLHIFGLLWSDNLEYGLHDLKVKLPLFAVPLALVAHPIFKRKEIHLILLTFLVSLLICSGINFNYFIQSISEDTPERFREMSQFGSHIRFSILVVIGFVISLYFAWQYPKWKLVFILIALWLSIYTFYSQVISGLLSYIAAIIFFLLYHGWKYRWIRFASVSIFVGSLVLAFFYFQNIGENKNRKTQVKLEKLTAQGHMYYHDTINPIYEQGKPIYVNLSDEELWADWSKYSKLDYTGKDEKGQTLRATLYRYMTAKNLKKDAIGLSQLTKKDIRNIEKGIPSPQLLDEGILSRISTIRYQIENAHNPNGQTLLQRIEYWKTGIQIIKENPLIGVGTGDVQDEFNEQYAKNKTLLEPQYWFRAHNMFLTVQISFGIIGSVFFLSFLISFLKNSFQRKNILAVCLFGVIVVSFFIEDTLETQTGVTLFSLFFALFLPTNNLLTEKEPLS